MERAANIAQASEFIHRMEKTFESPVEEREPISLVDKNKGCRLRVGLSAIHVF